MVRLFIDDGVSGRPHRLNMLTQDKEYTGIAYCKHSKYGQMIVVVYGDAASVGTRPTIEVKPMVIPKPGTIPVSKPIPVVDNTEHLSPLP